MIILLDNFLANEEWRKYQLLKRVERSSYFALTKKELMDYLEISNYVLKSTIDQLILDLERFGLAEEIHLFVEEPFVQLEVTGTASSETLLENYVEESISFNILLGAVLGKYKSLNELSEKEMISYPIAHSTYKKLNKYLAAFDLTIDKKFRLSGKSEKNVRLFLTELFSRIYKGNDHIFDHSDTTRVQAVKKSLATDTISIHQKINLQHYLCVTNLRIQQQKYMETSEQSILLKEEPSQEISKALLNAVPEEFQAAECSAFFYYYAARSENLSSKLNLSENAQIAKWSGNLLSSLIRAFPKLALDEEKQRAFLTHSHFLHFQLLETSSAYETIQPEINIAYFQQNFPAVLEFCRVYITRLQQTDPELFKKKKQLLFQYLFLVLDSFPKSMLLETVNVYVDFSFGNLYNEFIMENLAFFQLVGAEVVSEIGPADILLTDSRDLGREYNKECIVWLAPPRPLDWANLGQKIIQKRSEKGSSME